MMLYVSFLEKAVHRLLDLYIAVTQDNFPVDINHDNVFCFPDRELHESLQYLTGETSIAHMAVNFTGIDVAESQGIGLTFQPRVKF